MKYTKKLLDDACRMMAERLQTELPQIPQSMEAAGMRLVLLPDFDKFERYTKTWVCRFYFSNFWKFIFVETIFHFFQILFQEGSENLYNDIMNIHKINCAVYPIQGELFLRLSANIYNEMDDYVKLADLLVQLLKKVWWCMDIKRILLSIYIYDIKTN